MAVFNTINVKDLPQLEEIIEGNFIIVENEFGSNILDFKDFVIGPNNASFYNSITLLSAYSVSSIIALSAADVVLSNRISVISSFESYVQSTTALETNIQTLCSTILQSTSALETNIQILCSTIRQTSAFYFESGGLAVISLGNNVGFYNFNSPYSGFNGPDFNIVRANQHSASAVSWVAGVSARRNTGTFPTSASFINTLILFVNPAPLGDAVYQIKAFKQFIL